MKDILFVEYGFPSKTTFLRYKFQTLSKEFSVTFASRQGKKERKEYQKLYGPASLVSMEIPWQRPFEFFCSFFAVGFTSPVKLVRFMRFCQKAKGKKKGIKYFFQCFPLIKKNWELIHFEFGTISREFIFLADFFNSKVVTSFRGYDMDYVGLGVENYYQEVWEKSNMIHFLGNGLMKKGLERGMLKSQSCVLIPPAIFIEQFPWKERSLPKQGTIHIVSVGRLTWIKGYMIGLMALKKLMDHQIDFQYHIVGAGDEEQAIRFHICDLGLKDRVVLHGRKSPKEVEQILSDAHLFFHPAISEGFCNAVIEAQSVGLPVVCSNAGGLPENIENGVTGLLFESRNADDAFQKIFQLLNDSTLYLAMNAAGHKRVSQFFDMEKQVATFSDVYRKMLA